MLIRFVLIVVTGSILILLWMNIRMQYLKNIISDTIVVHGKTISEDGSIKRVELEICLRDRARKA